MMWRRKIQLIAGSTYSISLPKEWINKNKLRAKTELLINEGNDNHLVISPEITSEKNKEEISINLDEHFDIEQIMFSVYYLGFEKINLFSKKQIPKDLRMKIIRAVSFMSGTEISHEDNQGININVLLDKSKLDITQILYRISLLLDSSIENILIKPRAKEAKFNEDEIDRLFHLMTKAVSISLTNQNVLQSSKINSISFIPSLFLVGKRLENLGDVIYHFSKYAEKNPITLENKKRVLQFIRAEVKRSIAALTEISSRAFQKVGTFKLNEIKEIIKNMKDQNIAKYFTDTLRYLVDIQEEVVNISFCKKLIQEGII